MDIADIADIVLENESVVLVVENYFTSDGHGHSYEGYRSFGERDGKVSVVVLLCGTENVAAQTDGWEGAAVLTYSTLVSRLVEQTTNDAQYKLSNPHQFSFFEQMYQYFVRGRGMSDNRELARFVGVLCETGEAAHFQTQNHDAAAVSFADRLREQALEQFGESRAFLQRVKSALKNYCSNSVIIQVNQSLGTPILTGASARYQGIYQWTINFDLSGATAVEGMDEAAFQIKFGPSAWYANTRDAAWNATTRPSATDYSCLFLTHRATKQVRQSAVTLEEVLNGVAADDFRLRDEILDLLRPTTLSPFDPQY